MPADRIPAPDIRDRQIVPDLRTGGGSIGFTGQEATARPVHCRGSAKSRRTAAHLPDRRDRPETDRDSVRRTDTAHVAVPRPDLRPGTADSRRTDQFRRQPVRKRVVLATEAFQRKNGDRNGFPRPGNDLKLRQIDRRVHRHDSNIITAEQLHNYNCPIQIVSHGDVPHTVLAKHPNARS